MKRAVFAAVTSLTLVATSVATAATEPTPSAQPSAEPLQLKPSKPLVLAPESSGTSWYVKVIAAAALGGVAFWFWRKRKMQQRPEVASSRLRIVSRAVVGARTEVLVVDAGGTRVLVGVTPQSMQTLAVLPDEPIKEAEDEVEAPKPVARRDDEDDELPRVGSNAQSTFAERARSLLGAPSIEYPVTRREPVSIRREVAATPAPARASSPAPRRSRPTPAPAPADREEGGGVEGQARGLRAVIRGRKS